MTCPSCGAESLGTGAVCAACGDPLPLGAGSVVASRYEIESRLGKGGMGTVYRARDRMLGEEVALKVLNADLASTPEMGERFRSEIRLARKVTHRNVCRIHDYGEEGPLRFISMQFIDGEDLRQVLRRRGGLPPEEAFEVAIQTADGLQAIHDEGIIHRDLKSPNIMRDRRGVARLMDFGIAKQWQEGEGGGLTMTGQVVGTPEYMSPEQVRGEKLDFRSDVYALGIVVFELFTGSVPFKAPTPFATIMMQLEAAPPLEGASARGIPEPVLPVLKRALAKDPKHRFGSVREMGEALRAARAAALGQPSPTAAATAPWAAPVTGGVTAVPAAPFVSGSSTAAAVPAAPRTDPQSQLTDSTTVVPVGTPTGPDDLLATRAPTPAPPGPARAEAPATARVVPPPHVGRGGPAGRWLALGAMVLAVGVLGWYWLGRRPPVKVVESGASAPDRRPTAEPVTTPTTLRQQPTSLPERPGPSVPPAPSASPKLPTPGPTGGGGLQTGGTQVAIDLRALDQLAREDPEAALVRVRDLERQHPGDSAIANRRARFQAQLGDRALELARRTLAQAKAEGSLELYARAIQGFTRAVELNPGNADAARSLGEAIEGEARLKAQRSLVSFVLSETTITGATPHVVNAPPGMGEAPPGVIVKKAQTATLKARIVIETEPPQVKKGEQVIFRYYLENQTANPLRVSDALVQTVIGQGTTTGGKIEPQTKLAEPGGKALLLESRDAWRLDPGTEWKTMLRVVLADGTVLAGSLQARR